MNKLLEQSYVCFRRAIITCVEQPTRRQFTILGKIKPQLTVQICVLPLQGLHISFILFPPSAKVRTCIRCWHQNYFKVLLNHLWQYYQFCWVVSTVSLAEPIIPLNLQVLLCTRSAIHAGRTQDDSEITDEQMTTTLRHTSKAEEKCAKFCVMKTFILLLLLLKLPCDPIKNWHNNYTVW